MRRSEQAAEVCSVGESEKRRPFDVGVVQDCEEVGNEHLDRGQVAHGEAIRESRPPAVDDDES